MKASEGMVMERDVLPIFVIPKADPVNPVSFQGTGFLIGPGLMITCWHCLREALPADHDYAVGIKSDNHDRYDSHVLFDISQDENGTDLAAARVDLQPNLSLVLDNSPVPTGLDVLTYGYPLTDSQRIQNGQIDFLLNPRYLQGYITRVFNYSHPEFGEVMSYELDMPTPAGLSGAPLIRLHTRQVVGVVYGSNDVGSIDHFASVNPETGHREPEIQRIVSFGLAHHVEIINNLRSVATEHQPLSDYL